ncbi:peptidoglycan glycosyltransferase FtsW [Stakelama saccharophila]|uniref:Probable peptidoglycan glycosyltransferase FtsW n=1 Tax=Stakelama saccharophila TaxID=3075605 RepID=A0ABZ0B925_9SPHN|nr:putative peptidoglycan glycosyltransferase FtsW [Stakelama sp. W311]WNO53111.1 putative peptidoglycan glycosyltransferase FtsW [Stakelama sp. W311]
MTDIMRSGDRGMRARMEQQLGRASRSPIGAWFRDIDRVLLLLAFLLIAIGLVAVAAASPASAERYSGGSHQITPMYYFWRQAGWVALSVPVLLAVSMLPVTFARRAALIGTVVFLALLALTPFVGVEANGARRWIGFGFAQFQPSEFLKPMFIVTTAWILSLKAEDRHLPVVPITMLLTGLVGLLLMLQPDFGQTMIFGLIWLILLLIAGTSPRILAGLAGLGLGGIIMAYMFYGTARARIDGFLFPDSSAVAADTYQTDMAHAVLTAGGLTGTGPGAGSEKFLLPEAHTDYIYAVVGEEFGYIACAVITILFLAIVTRVFVKQLEEDDPFRLLAASGLAAEFGVQAMINMAVNTGLAPSKGMTLPFISYGGSSMVALSIGMGLLLAFTRRNPYLSRSSYGTGWKSK